VRPDWKAIPQIPLLTASEESPCGTHDVGRYGLQIIFPQEPKRDPVTESRVQTRQPGLDHSRIFSFGEHPDQLEGKPQPLFGIPVKLASVHLPVDGAHVLDANDPGGELAADETDELLNDLRDGEANRFTVRSKIRARFGNRGH
jgi:hypothetical protein